MTDDNKKLNAVGELKMAAEALAAAKHNANGGYHATAINRLYYAAYHTALAVLLSEGLEPKSHRGITHLLKLHFVQKGTLPDWVDSSFSKLQSERELVDYEPAYSADAAAYVTLRAVAEKLLGELERYLRERGFLE